VEVGLLGGVGALAHERHHYIDRGEGDLAGVLLALYQSGVRVILRAGPAVKGSRDVLIPFAPEPSDPGVTGRHAVMQDPVGDEFCVEPGSVNPPG